MDKIKIIKGSELPIIEDLNKSTFLAYEGKTIGLKSGRIDFSKLTPLFGVTQEMGQSITLAPSQKLFTDNLTQVESNLINPVSYVGNLVDGEQITLQNVFAGKYIDLKGVEKEIAPFSYGEIDVTNRFALRVAARSGQAALLVAWYDVNSKFISGTQAPSLPSGQMYDLYHIKPNNAVTAKISYVTSLGCIITEATISHTIFRDDLKKYANEVTDEKVSYRNPVQRYLYNGGFNFPQLQSDIISCIVDIDFRVTSKYAHHKFTIIAFGIDTDRLTPNKQLYFWVKDLTGNELNIINENLIIRFQKEYTDEDLVKPVVIERYTDDLYFSVTIDFGKAKILQPDLTEWIWGKITLQITPEISDDFAAKQSDIYTLNEIIGEDKSPLYQYDNMRDKLTLIDGVYLDKDGEKLVDLSSFATYDYYDVSDLYAIKTTMRVGSAHSYLSYYDKDKRPVENNVSEAGTFTRVNIKPKNAKYVRISHPKTTQPADFAIESVKITSIIESLKNQGANRKTPLDGLKRILFIPIYGQSLSVGGESNPAISTTQKYNGLKFNVKVISRPMVESLTGFAPLIEQGAETSASGTNEMFIEALRLENAFSEYEGKWDDVQLLFICCGVGGTAIDPLLSEEYYKYLRNAIQGAKNICDAKGYTLEVPAWCWIQGETDLRLQVSESDYTNSLIALQEKITTDVKNIIGQTKAPKCIMYQTANQSLYSQDYNFANGYLAIPTAQMKLIRDDERFMASVPAYIFDVVPTHHIHIPAYAEKLLGGYQGYALKKHLIDGVQNKGVVPLSFTVSDNDILIKYSMPCPPLVFDTQYIREIKNMGFTCVKPNDADIVESVSLFNDTVTIHCSESPIGAKLRYALNTPIKGDGRDYGSRGNLRDSQGNYIYKEIEGYKEPLHNWAYAFEELIS